MMGFILYMLIAFIVLFIFYKKYNPILKERKKESYDALIEYKEFWIIYILPFFWIVAAPLIILWAIMEKIYNKFNN